MTLPRLSSTSLTQNQNLHWINQGSPITLGQNKTEVCSLFITKVKRKKNRFKLELSKARKIQNYLF